MTCSCSLRGGRIPKSFLTGGYHARFALVRVQCFGYPPRCELDMTLSCNHMLKMTKHNWRMWLCEFRFLIGGYHARFALLSVL